jgi:peptidyl-prolyl cis-trans isomerase SurA
MPMTNSPRTAFAPLFRPLWLAALAVLLAAAPQSAARAQQIERIAAVVNDEVISSTDVIARMQMVMFAANLPPTEENQRRLLPQVLRALIDEKLREQEADRYDVEVPEEDVRAAVADIARQNNMSPDRFAALLSANDVPIWTLEEQLRIGLEWRELVRQRLRPSVTISEEEIDEVVARIEENRGLPEYQVAEIFLAVDDPAREDEVRRFAEELVAEIRRGAPFRPLARQFSQGAGAAVGGDLGWVLEGQLDPALDRALAEMQPGQVSEPIRSVAGYHVLLLRGRRQAAVPDPRDAVIAMHRLALVFPPNTTRAQANRIRAAAEEVSETVASCEELAAVAEEMGAPPADAGTGRLGELPAQLADLLADLPENQPSEPIRMSDGIAVFMVCDRQVTSPTDREQISLSLGEERMDMLQRRYLRDLRSAAFIDVRL